MANAIEALLYDGARPDTSEPGIWYVRIKPFNKRTGHLLRSVTFCAHNFRIKEESGWRRMRQPSIELLRDLYNYRNEPGDEHAPLALDVCTFEEGKILERREKEAAVRRRETRADIDHAGAMTTADLPSDRLSRAEQRRHNNERSRREREAERTERDARRTRRSPADEAREEEEEDARRAQLKREQAAAQAELDAMDRAEEARARELGRTPETAPERSASETKSDKKKKKADKHLASGEPDTQPGEVDEQLGKIDGQSPPTDEDVDDLLGLGLDDPR